MLGEKFGHFCLNRLRQQGARPVTQHLGERIGERPWLKQFDDVSIGHGVSLLYWRSGGSNTPTIRRLLPVRPSPTSAHSSCDLAMDHSRGGMIHSFSDRFKTRKRSLVAASSVGKWPLALTARRSLAFSASMAFVVYKIRRTSPGKA